MPLLFSRLVPALAWLLLAAAAAPPALAQSVCSSDGQARPVALVERFINADCRDCWSDAASPRARRGELALDWVLPGRQGEDAPLSAVASRDGLRRLQALGLAPPAASSNRISPVAPQGRLRVAHGLPVAGYVGTSIELRHLPTAMAAPFSAWLALVETVPAGTEGSPLARNLVRNMLQPSWDGREQLSKGEHPGWRESRVMDIPPGTDPSRLAVIGWVQDASGRVVAAAQSRCVPAR